MCVHFAAIDEVDKSSHIMAVNIETEMLQLVDNNFLP